MKEFDSFGKMATHLLTLQAGMALSLHKGLDEVVTAIQKTAKEEVGHYQGAVGPFPAWAPLAASTQADRVRRGFTADDPGLRRGDMRDSIKKEVALLEGVVGSDDQNLVYFEIGTDKQPPRPVLGPAVEHNHEKIVKVLGAAAVRGILGGGAIPAHLEYDHDV
ncbi:hypothetical protein Herbaro_09455 [Herbaspirillum sp. WKF16]|uniref:hypothetical protein n=1 Tax=Herbaspirillum sp. WKF16 TaxID=3028312 RepID=UPI0023A9D6F4|nr:hypothetical protein [Herbaspirillum sp. WKF16]WDZ97986.1 hypothetical protein Herbaro_09455 [Herbaspirillum sp. WKF16]